MRVFRSSAGIAFALAGVVGLVGCVWLAGSYQSVDGRPRPETRIGKPGSGKPLRISDATRADAFRVLGAPAREGVDGRWVLYEYDVSTGFWLYCFVIPDPTVERRYLRIDFDESDRLKSFKVFRYDDAAIKGFFKSSTTREGSHG